MRATEGFWTISGPNAKSATRSSSAIRCRSTASETMWASAGQAATIGIFLLLFGAFLYIGRAILLPILAAAVIALTLAPLIKAAKRHGISPWITGLVILLFGLGGLSLLAMALAGPVSAVDRPRAGDRRHASSRSFRCSISRSPRCMSLRVRCSAATPRLACSSSQCCAPGGRLSHAGRGRAAAVLRHALFLSGRPDRSAQSSGRDVRQPRYQAAFFENHARHRAQSRRLSDGGDDHQCRGRHHRRGRRLARRLAQSGDFRTSGGIIQLRALYRDRR